MIQSLVSLTWSNSCRPECRWRFARDSISPKCHHIGPKRCRSRPAAKWIEQSEYSNCIDSLTTYAFVDALAFDGIFCEFFLYRPLDVGQFRFSFGHSIHSFTFQFIKFLCIVDSRSKIWLLWVAQSRQFKCFRRSIDESYLHRWLAGAICITHSIVFDVFEFAPYLNVKWR